MMEIKHKDNSIFLVFKNQEEADIYEQIHGLYWQNIGIRLRGVCLDGHMNAFKLIQTQ